jgi:hypothetical protein
VTRYIHLWLFPVGVLVALLILSINSFAGDLAALAWGFVVAPHVAVWLVRHRRTAAVTVEDPLELQSAYWRTGNWQSGSQ